MSTPTTTPKRRRKAPQAKPAPSLTTYTVKLRSPAYCHFLRLYENVLDVDLETEGVPASAAAGRVKIGDGDTLTEARRLPHSHHLICKTADGHLVLVDSRDLAPNA
ncbi:MAG: hypothetical protein OJI67_08635 [Prosthecobacter sp.]|nr:hypothetical protein [Prosthecobacter sp.]